MIKMAESMPVIRSATGLSYAEIYSLKTELVAAELGAPCINETGCRTPHDCLKRRRCWRREAPPGQLEIFDLPEGWRSAWERQPEEPGPQSFIPLLPEQASIARISDSEIEAIWERMRWPDGVRCPRCATAEPYRVKRTDKRAWHFHCRNTNCSYNFSHVSGTRFASAKVSLRVIFVAVSLVQHNAGDGVIRRVYKTLGVRYKTAYCLLGRAKETLFAGLEGESFYRNYANGHDREVKVSFPRAALRHLLDRQVCRACGIEKPTTAFPPRPGISGEWGLRARICNECRNANLRTKGVARWQEWQAEYEAETVKHQSAAELLRDAPKDDRYWYSRGRWAKQDKHDLLTLLKAGVSPTDAGRVLRRSPTSVAWYARDLLTAEGEARGRGRPRADEVTSGIILPPAWRAITAPTRLVVPAAPRILVYPYLPKMPVAGDRGGELIMAVNNAVPKYLPDHLRADLAQELLLAILSGELKIEDLSAAAVRRVRSAVRTSDLNTLSFEDMERPDDERAFLGMHMPAGVMERLEW